MKYIKSNYIVFIVLLLFSEIYPLTILPLFISLPSIVWQLSLYFTLIMIIMISFKDFRIEWRLLLFIIFAIISLILSETDVRYGGPERLISWIILISAVGPLLYNAKLIDLRIKLFNITLYVFMLIGSLSFLYWIFALPNLGRGHFTGIMMHSMLLAPIASLGALYALYNFFSSKIYIIKYIFLLFFITNFISVLLAASRSALAALFVSIVVLLFLKKFKYKKIIMVITLPLFIVYYLLNINSTNLYNKKGNNEIINSIQDRGLTNTREFLWNDRIKEFKANPIFGVGFASQDDKLISASKGSKEGKIEPGSTYLMILSMTGLFGAISMLYFFLKAFMNKLFWMRLTSVSQYKIASFTFFFIHFLGEGYLFASGSLMAFVFWTLLGSTYAYSGIDYNILGEKYEN